ncbi:hypothetical protein FGIG_11693 [Fasciola gigantica]|uniref:Uncharacterized protein n=1 Tax=Fasciola gigantica TaxID=46835 RepID=A0A504YFQ8_FASGI|nr:hypothetical protein FGIG_11693 [Fasciola gigantica]
MLPIKYGSRPPTRLLSSHPEGKDSLLNVVEGKTFQNRSTPMPELNLTPFVSQPQISVARRALHGTSMSNATPLQKPNNSLSQNPTKNRSPFVASHTWSSNNGLGSLSELGLFDNPTVLRFERYEHSRL